MELNSCLCVMNIFFKFESPKKMKTNNKLLSQETYKFQIVGNDTMIIADYKDIKISSFHLFVVKLWLKEDDGLQTNHL